MTLPVFRYHVDPLRSGSVVESSRQCRACRTARGFVYAGPVYAEKNLDDALCPWCVADGTAHEKFDSTFVDSEAFADGIPAKIVDEIMERTPGYNVWQVEQWPGCCGDATAFLTPSGIQELRETHRELEGEVMSHIVYNMQISGGAATRLLDSLNREKGPTLYIFRCLHCDRYHFHIDQP